MSKNITDNNLATDAKSALMFWEEHSDIKLQDANCTAFRKAQSAFQQAADDVVQQETQLHVRVAQRDTLGAEVQDVVTRLRTAVRGIYGSDSHEYQQLGGTRLSDRKRPVRRTNGAVTVPANGNGNGGVTAS